MHLMFSVVSAFQTSAANAVRREPMAVLYSQDTAFCSEMNMPVQHREFLLVDAATRRRSDAASLRATYAGDQIELFRRFEPDVDDMLATFGIGPRSGEQPRSGSAPLLRFVLRDEQVRIFSVERFEDGVWREVAAQARVTELARYVREA